MRSDDIGGESRVTPVGQPPLPAPPKRKQGGQLGGTRRSAAETQQIREYFERDIVEEYRRYGANFTLATYINVFGKRNKVERSMLYKWFHAMGAASVGPAAGEPKVLPPPGNELVTLGVRSPTAQRLSELAARGNTVAVIRNLERSLSAANHVLEKAEKAGANANSPWVILRASEQIRRCAETAIKLHDAMWNVQRIEEFHRTVIQIVAEESPAAAERVMRRLEELAQQWTQPGA